MPSMMYPERLVWNGKEQSPHLNRCRLSNRPNAIIEGAGPLRQTRKPRRRWRNPHQQSEVWQRLQFRFIHAPFLRLSYAIPINRFTLCARFRRRLAVASKPEMPAAATLVNLRLHGNHCTLPELFTQVATLGIDNNAAQD